MVAWEKFPLLNNTIASEVSHPSLPCEIGFAKCPKQLEVGRVTAQLAAVEDVDPGGGLGPDQCLREAGRG
jgi:hypothetical protein